MQTATFGTKELGLFLSTDVEGRVYHQGEGADPAASFKPKRDLSKQVTRYWPGKAPKWVEGEEDELGEEARRRDVVPQRRDALQTEDPVFVKLDQEDGELVEARHLLRLLE